MVVMVLLLLLHLVLLDGLVNDIVVGAGHHLQQAGQRLVGQRKFALFVGLNVVLVMSK